MNSPNRNIEQRRTVHGGENSALAVEISPVVYRFDGIETCEDAAAHAYAVYIRNPLAFHIRDFIKPLAAGLHLHFDGDSYESASGALMAAFAFADELAAHLGCSVVSSAWLQRPGDPDTPAAPEPIPAATLAEVAACLWEAALDALRGPEGGSGVHAAAVAEQEAGGLPAMRSRVIALSEECERAWLALSQEERDDAGAFDWEFCPPWLYERMGWLEPEAKPSAGPGLVAGLRDMIDGARLTRADVPDDWEWLMAQLDQLNQAEG